MGERKSGVLAVAGLAAAAAARQASRRARAADLHGITALVTGGSRGLGLLIARELGRQGCRVAICARDQDELGRATELLRTEGIAVLPVACDVSTKDEVDAMVAAVQGHYGSVDFLVNNAGIMDVGPLQSMTVTDFEASMGVMFWGTLFPTLAVLPGMRERGRGWIVNVTSIGGRISAPHLLPYSAAKFAAVGLSEGLRAEVARDGISVTTVCPGFMRTGSYLNALFKSEQRAELTWFALASSLPLVTMSAERAARQIVVAARRGQADIELTWWAPWAARFHGLFPGTTATLAGVLNRFLPAYGGAGEEGRRGLVLRGEKRPLFDIVTRLGERSARRLNQLPGVDPIPTSARDHQSGSVATSGK